MKIDDKEVDRKIVDFYLACLERMPEDELLAKAKDVPQATKGFRPKHADPKIVRQRLRPYFAQSGEYPVGFLDLLREATLQAKFLAVVDETVLIKAVNLFADYLGRAAFYAAMLLDKRDALRDKARELIAEWKGDEPTQNESEAAARKLTNLFNPFLLQVLELTANMPATTNLSKKNPSTSTSTELTVAQKDELIDKSPLVRRLRRELKEASDGARKASAELVTLSVNCKNLSARMISANSELASLRDADQLNVDQRVARIFSERISPWFKTSERLRVSAQKLERDPLKRAEEVLRRQAEVDLRFGLREQHREQLEKVREFKTRIEEAKRESLRPLPDLVEVSSLLNNKILELENLLKEGSSCSGIESASYKKFAAAVQGCMKIDDVFGHREQLKHLSDNGQWEVSEIAKAYELLSAAALRFYLGDHKKLRPKDLTELGSGSPLQALRQCVVNRQRCTLLIDGHNVLFRWRPLLGQYFDGEVPGVRARAALIERLQQMAVAIPEVTTDLWFDGPQAEDQTICENLRVRFSGGVGRDRADQQIIAHLKYLHEQQDKGLKIVVTADQEFADAARKLDAMTMAPLELLNLMR